VIRLLSPAPSSAAPPRSTVSAAMPMPTAAGPAPIAPLSAPPRIEQHFVNYAAPATDFSPAPVAPPSAAPARIAPEPGAPKSPLAPTLGSSPGVPSVEPPPTPQASGGPSQGDVYLDGMRVGRWMSDTLAREATRPPAGSTFFDPRLTPSYSGAQQADA
jgi:hypothetical protein